MLPILTHPNEKLREVSKAVTDEQLKDPKLQAFMDEMIKTMYDDDGIGLAAPQVDERIRLFTVGKDAVKEFKMIKGEIKKGQDMVVVNPSWEKTSRKTIWYTEGCLSVPNVYGKVKRFKSIEVHAQDRHGTPLHFTASGYFAWVIQHETDHLNGILFIDRAKDLHTIDKKQMAL